MIKKNKFVLFLALIVLFCWPLWCGNVWAEDEDHQDEELNAFGFPEKSFVMAIEAEQKSSKKESNDIFPDCNDKRLIKQLKELISPYIKAKNGSILERRRVDLVIKNIKNFVPIKADDVKAEIDMPLADFLIELKINRHIDINDIKLCKLSNNIVGGTFYTVMFQKDSEINVDVINFTADGTLSFIFDEDQQKND